MASSSVARDSAALKRPGPPSLHDLCLSGKIAKHPTHGLSFLKAAVLFSISISLVFAAHALSQASRNPSPGSTLYSIAGIVVNAASGEPIRHANVAVLSEEDSHTIAAVESDSEGHFSLDRLPAGKYQLTASKRGFRTAFYDEHQEFNSAIVTGPGEETTKLAFRLVPGAVLRGVVITDGGDPVENARVMLFQKSRDGKAASRIAQSDNANTDDTGAYEFSNLAPGEYLLAVMAEPWYAMHRPAGRGPQLNPDRADDLSSSDPVSALDVAYPVTYFDSTTDEASAGRLQLAGGSRVVANITLHATPALRIAVNTPSKPDGSIDRAELRQTVFGAVVGAESAGFFNPRDAGITEFSGMAPGHYEISQGDPPRILDVDASSSLQVDPSLGVPTVAVHGVLRNSAGTPLGNDCNVALEPADGSVRQNSMQAICMRGAFNFPSVPAGQWQLSAEGAGVQLSIASVTVGGRIRAGNRITVQDLPLSVVVAITQGATRVTGFARRDGKGIPGVMVVLVPRELNALPALARRDQSDSDGSFSLRDVAPGQYTLVAIEGGWELDWAQPEVIARYLRGGIAVTVSDNPGKIQSLAEPVPVQTR